MLIQDIRVGQILRVKEDSSWAKPWRGKRIKVLFIHPTGFIDLEVLEDVNLTYTKGSTCNFCSVNGLELDKKKGTQYYPDWM